MGSIRGEGGAGGGGGGGGLADLVDDTTPQLGGNLDVNGHNVGGVTPTELGYLSGVSSAVQTQLDAKQASNANLSALAGQTGAADKVSYWTAAATLALATLTSFGRSVIAAADAAGLRSLLGLGTAATAATGDFAAASHTHAQSDVTNLVSDLAAKQPLDAELTALAGLTSAADKGIQFTGSGTAATYDLTAAGKALLDDADAAAQRTTLGLGTAATAASGDFQAANANLTALAGQTGAADKVSYWTAAATLALATLTAFGRSLIAAADAAGVRTLLGLGTTDSVAFGVVTGGNTSTFADVYFYNGTLSFGRGIISLMYNPSGAGTGYAIRLGDKTQELMLGSAVSEATFAAQRVHDFKGTTDATASLNQWLKGSTVVAEMTANGQLQLNISTGTAPLTVASTTVVTNLNADKLDGKDATDFAPCTQATLTAGASVALDFAAAGLATLTTNQNTTFTTSNRAAGRQPYNLRIIGGGAHTLTFPAGWVWLSSTMPASIASGKTGRLSLECYGSADTDIVASFAVET